MKTKSRLNSIVLCATIAFTMHAHAAPVTKAATGTDLTDGASWGGTAPAAAEVATWIGTSLGAGLTLGSDAAWQGIAVTGAASAVEISGVGILTLGEGGINMANSPVSATVASPISLGANQTWKVATGQSLTSSGAISGTSSLTIGSVAATATFGSFLTSSATTIFTNTSLASVTATSGLVGGAYVAGGTGSYLGSPAYLLSNNGTTATYQLRVLDGGYTKAVKVTLNQVGNDITGTVIYAKYIDGSNLAYNFDSGGNSNTIATSAGAGGYGAASTTVTLGRVPDGTVTLAGANTFTGALTVSAGTLKAGVSSVAGVSGAFGNNVALTLANANGAAIDLNGFNTQLGSLLGGGAGGGNVSLGSATLTTGADNTSTTFSGSISGTGGSLLKVGTGTLMLAGVNTYAGGTAVTDGRLVGNNDSAFGTGAISLGKSANNIELFLGNRADVSNPVIVSAAGTGTVVIGADNTGGGADPATFLGPITLNRAITFSGEVAADRLALDGKISGNPGTVTFQGGSRITLLSTLNDFTGDLLITGAGTVLQASVGTSAEVIPNGSSVTLDTGAVLQLSSSSGAETIDALNGDATTTVRTHSTGGFGSGLIVGSADGSGSFDGVLANGGTNNPLSLIKTGTGTQTLSGANTYTGTTTVNGGTLKLATGGSIANTGGLTVAPGALFDAADGGGFTLAVGRVMVAGDSSPAPDVTGPLTIAGTLRPAGGGTIGTLTGVTNLVLDGTLDIDRNAANTSCDSIVINGTLAINPGFTINISALGFPTVGLLTYPLVSGLTIPLTAEDLANLPDLPVNYTWNTADPTALRIDHTQPGTHLIWQGTVNGLWNENAANWSGSPGGIYKPGDLVTFDDTAAGTTTIEIPADVAPGALLVNNTTAKPYTVGSADGFGIVGETQLLKTGDGTLTLLSNNIYTGATTITAGVLAFGESGVSIWGPIRMNGGILRWHDINTQDISSALTLVAGQTAILDTNGNDVVFLSGVGNSTSTTLAKVGAGNLTLRAAGTATGVTTVLGGTLTAANNAAFGSSVITLGDNTEPVALMLGNRADVANPITVSATGTGTVTIGGDTSGTGADPCTYSGAVTLNRATTISSAVPEDRTSFDGKISGNVGLLTVTGGSRTALSSALNDFIGDILITGAGSTLQASVATAAEVIPDATNVTIEAGAILQLASSAGTESINGLKGDGMVRTYAGQPGAFGSGLTVGTANGSGTFSGTLVNGNSALSLTKTGTGTQVLSGFNTYTGNTVVNNGTLDLAETGRLTFRVTDAATNTLTGTGTVTLNGGFAIDPSAVTVATGSWQLENVVDLTGAYGGTFKVVDPDGTAWRDAGSNQWSRMLGDRYFTFNELDGTLTVAVADYQDWADHNAPGETMDMDHDHDGVPNGIEYFMGQNGDGFTPSPVLAADGQISWPKDAYYSGSYGIDYVLETSPDLVIWTPVPVGNVAIDSDSVDYTLPHVAPKQFVRLKVTGP